MRRPHRVAAAYLELAVLVRALEGLAAAVRFEASPDRGSLWAGLFDLRENLLGRAQDDCAPSPHNAAAAMALELTVVGSINLDFAVRVDRLPRPVRRSPAGSSRAARAERAQIRPSLPRGSAPR